MVSRAEYLMNTMPLTSSLKIILLFFLFIGFFSITAGLILGDEERQDGLYKDNGQSAFLLERGASANIEFYLQDDLDDSVTNIEIRYFVLVNYDESKEPDESRTIPINTVTNPIIIPHVWNQSGSFFLRQQADYLDANQNSIYGKSSSMQVIVVDKLGKILTDEGICKKEGMIPTFKYDFSRVACVSFETSYELGIRGWSASQ